MNAADYVLLACIACAVVAAIFAIRKQQKKGGCCGDCAQCSHCGKQKIHVNRWVEPNHSAELASHDQK